MFQPHTPGAYTYALKNNGLVLTYNEHGNVIDVWHPNNVANALERDYNQSPTSAELTADQVAEIAEAVASRISEQLSPNLRRTPFDADFMADVQRDFSDRAFNRVAYGGKRAGVWIENPTERGLPVSALGVQALGAVCNELDEQHPAQRADRGHRMLLAALLFGEFVFPPQLD